MFRETLKDGSKDRKRRDRLYIMAEILEIAKHGCLKTQIMYRANLSFAQLNDYLSFLLEVGLLRETNESEKTVYVTTQKGGRFLRSYFKIKNLLNAKNENPSLENSGALCLGNHRKQIAE